MRFSIFPYLATEEILNLPLQVVQEQLGALIQLNSYHAFNNQKDKMLYGTFNQGTFRVYHKTPGRKNRFKPEIVIRLSAINEQQTHIFFEFKLPLAKRIFISIYICVALLFTFLFSSYSLQSQFLPLGLIGFMMLIMYAGHLVNRDAAIAHLTKEVYKIKRLAKHTLKTVQR